MERKNLENVESARRAEDLKVEQARRAEDLRVETAARMEDLKARPPTSPKSPRCPILRHSYRDFATSFAVLERTTTSAQTAN